MKDSYDVVVIGSGFGGAVAACRLAEKGRSVAVLERGKRWGKLDFPRTTGQVASAFWNTKDLGLLDYRIFKRMDVLQASGVGGGSLVYFNVHLRAPKEVFEDPRWPRGVKRSSLDPYYDRAKAVLEATPLKPPAGAPLPHRTTAFLRAAAGAGRRGEAVDICVYTGPDRRHPTSGIPQSACVYCGNCMLGCHVHAKNTLDLNYLPAAERHGAEVHPLHLVERIEDLGSGVGYRVHFRRFEGGGGAAVPGTVVGRKVVVSAGSLGSTEILLRSRDRHGTLPRLSQRLGERFSGNGDFLLAGTFDAASTIDPGWGPSITAGADFSRGEHRITIQDLGFPDPFLWFLEGNLPLPGRLANLVRALKVYVLRTVGLSRESRFTVGIDKLFRGGVTTRFLPYLGMGNDAADGHLRLQDDAIDVVWEHERSRALFRAMEQGMRELSAAAGGRFETSPLWRWPARKLLTAHPLGGCAMADSKDLGVVDEYGEVYDYPGLYVADGAIIPTALTVNPSATIAALSERIAEHIAAR